MAFDDLPKAWRDFINYDNDGAAVFIIGDAITIVDLMGNFIDPFTSSPPPTNETVPR